MRLVPASSGLTGNVCAGTAGPYGSQTFTAESAGTGGNSASFLVSTGTSAESATYEGEYYLCYQKSADSGMAVVTDEAGTPATFSIYPTDVMTVTDCPSSGNVFAFETAVFNITPTDLSLYPNAQFSDYDQFVLVDPSLAATCEDVGSVELLLAAATAPYQVVQPTRENYVTGSSNWYATLPSIDASVNYLLCFKLEYDNSFRNVSPGLANYTVQREDPYSYTLSPPVILPTSTGVVITVEGVALSNSDRVYIVDSSQNCDETCDRPITPVIYSGATYRTQFVSTTQVQVLFDSAINEVVTLGVCYRRAGRYLTRLGDIYVGDPNPVSYVVNFAPRVGTRPRLTFTGTDLTATDKFMIVLPGQTCLERNAVATGTFVSVSADAVNTEFDILLTNVQAQNYVVCYHVSTRGGYAVVDPVLNVADGGPTALSTTNQPMVGRAFNLSVASTNTYAPQAGDEMFIACPTCACADGVTASVATVPYGTPSVTVTAENLATFHIRVGLNVRETFPVCYRVAGSGFAEVSSITPGSNSPYNVVVVPTPTYQGQRMTFNLTNYTAQDPASATDSAMIVLASRGCWEPEWYETSLIYSGPTVAASYTQQTSLVQWNGHVPSLGPNTPASSLFPMTYLLCYREASQAEYVAVPFPTVTPMTVQPANPATFTTTPATIESGMIGVSVVFPNAAEGDTAYAVQFTTLTNTVCTDESSTIMSPSASAYPEYSLNIAGNAVGSANTALCYVKAGATVAEVPQLLSIVAGNPSGYTTNVTDVTADARERQYIEFTVAGTGLATSDGIAFLETPCGEATLPIQSTSNLRRMGDKTVSADGSSVVFVAQFVATTSPITVYMCYSHSGVWREVGSPLVLRSPIPSEANMVAVSSLSSRPRAGQHLYIVLQDPPTDVYTMAAVISANDTLPGSWCHNYTASDVREPWLVIRSSALLDFTVWENPGVSRLCLLRNGLPWVDVATTVDGSSLLDVAPANPSSMEVYPSPPRVGQSVTLTFHLIVTASVGDVIKVVSSDNLDPCEVATTVNGFDATIPVTVVDANTTQVTLVDNTDALNWRSFNTTGTYHICYYSSEETAWGVVGGTFASGSFTVEPLAPQTWVSSTTTTMLGTPFSLTFSDTAGVLNATNNLVWAAPSTQNCGVDPYACPTCILFELST
ncbi:hypothetical protein AGDE_06669 [Angomonas deanei]|uniref:Uncharacterized protein n=1 Tax=Angomonas deanei TaxID=59799 RepID=A0A7G2CT23_9TRYP|nr:hypothetical protein AGDE_06669 [Angomonas deanei]CAD2222948.1 hypothetical protein, conserved [Angomonas deanei]|eukprot:EPY36934.1 hypothetical protein AGDE_06669 [Angomonas deanei]